MGLGTSVFKRTVIHHQELLISIKIRLMIAEVTQHSEAE